MKNNLTVTMTAEKTAEQNEKWKVLSEKLFQKPSGELSDYAAWLDEFSDAELMQYCDSIQYSKAAKFREIFERWDKPNFDRIMSYNARK